jgi:copper(I)-binding protein
LIKVPVRSETRGLSGFAGGTSGAELQARQPGNKTRRSPDTLLPVTALRAALTVLAAAALTAACAAGQQAQTANENPSIDGTSGAVGSIRLEGVALHTPPKSSYPAGATVPMSVYIANSGTTPDTLVNVTSDAFKGWDVVPTPAVQAAPAAGAAASGAPQRVGPGASVGLGLQNLAPNGNSSAETLVLQGLADSAAPLYPGQAVRVTFTFAKAGQTTLTVPVKISEKPNEQTLRPSYVPPSG